MKLYNRIFLALSLNTFLLYIRLLATDYDGGWLGFIAGVCAASLLVGLPEDE